MLHSVEAMSEYVPAAQSIHALALEAPDTVEDFPALQDKQNPSTEELEYFPNGQVEHNELIIVEE